MEKLGGWSAWILFYSLFYEIVPESNLLPDLIVCFFLSHNNVCGESLVPIFLRKGKWSDFISSLIVLFCCGLGFTAVRQQVINQKLIFPATSKNESLWQTKYGLNEAYRWFVLIRYKVNVPAIVTFIKVRTRGCLDFPALPF